MASRSKRRPENVPGDFFVDTTCIYCDTCRWMAPETFDDVGDMSRVHAQPADPASVRRALQALVACPTASIGTVSKHDVKSVAADFPLPVVDGIFHCGFHDEASFGATSYLVVRPEGNVLVDAPRFAAPLVRRLEEMGGVRTLFLTHRDDVGDHALFHAHFGCERVLHADDAHGALRSLERLIEGPEDVELAPDLRVIPVPGHTRGSACLLHKGEYLFTGDHLAWSPSREQVTAFRSACWYDWDVQIESMRRLAERRFTWILPGHGRRCSFPAEEMRARMAACVRWMEDVR
jgi:glyoxylase-like metal-dependent hydrolase (beta-lactamase superfamily II)/ferredoxin